MNDKQSRKESLKKMLNMLHGGAPVEAVKAVFQRELGGVSGAEIAEAEQALVAEGLQVEEIQKLCDIHAAVFKGSVSEIHRTENGFKTETEKLFSMQNREIEKLLKDAESAANEYAGKNASADKLQHALVKLEILDTHYKLKETVFFPNLEKRGVTAPPKVMWGVDDKIREARKELVTLLTKPATDKTAICDKVKDFVRTVSEMIYKEEKILLPMLSENLTEEDYKSILHDMQNFDKESPDTGYDSGEHFTFSEGKITLPSGVFDIKGLVAMLNTLPFDITFVDKDDKVAYFSEGSERLFPRARSVIGRAVTNCHPPQSVHMVKKILLDFKNKVKDHEDFWIKMKGLYILIRYYAVRDSEGNYLGCLEVSQNIAPIQEITGEKRLMM